MKSSFNFIVLFGTIFFNAYFIQAQKFPNKITFIDGSIAHGIADLSNLNENVILFSVNDQKLKLIPDQVFKLEDTTGFHIYVEEVSYQLEKKKVFIRSILQSSITLYEGYVNSNEKVFYLHDEQKSNKRIKLNYTGFWHQLKALYPQCDLRKRSIYNKDEITSAIKEIINCMTPSETIIKYKNPKDFKLDVGISYGYFTTSTYETGWYGPARQITKDYDPIESMPLHFFIRTYLGNKFIFKSGITYYSFNLNNDSLTRAFLHRIGGWKVVTSHINFDVSKIKIPIMVGYNFTLSKASSLILETGSSFTVFNKIKMNKDHVLPYTSSDNTLRRNTQTMHIQTQLAYRYKVNRVMFEPYIKYENGYEKIDTYSPNYEFPDSFSNLRMGRFEYGFTISYRLLNGIL